jgi:hypothetical protein
VRDFGPACDVISLKVEDVAPNEHAVERATVRRKKTAASWQLFDVAEMAHDPLTNPN